MHFLICHKTQTARKAVLNLVQRSNANIRISAANNLSQAYHLVEHEHPDRVIVDFDLAQSDDFQQFSKLLSILKIKRLITCPTRDALAKCSKIDMPSLVIGTSPYDHEVTFKTLIAAFDATEPRNRDSPSRQPLDPSAVILIGASTGGVDAVAKVISHFDMHSPPTLIVQHTGGEFASSLIRFLDNTTHALVRPAIDGDTPKQGHIYLAPNDDVHLCLKGKNRKIGLVNGPSLSGHRPAIDALFNSARPWAKHMTAALLTGMGKDGAAGLLTLKQAGSYTIAQDQATSVVFGMPRVARELGAVCAQLPINKIGPALLYNVRAK